MLGHMQLPGTGWHVATITIPLRLDRILNVLCRSGLCHRCYRGDPGERLDGIDGFSPGELYRGIFRGTLVDQTLKAKDVCGLV